MIYNEKYECMERDALEKLQGDRLCEKVKYVYDRVPYYKKKMDDMGVKPEDIKTLADITKLPFTVKQDLRDNYPFGTFAVDMDDIVRVHASSGTTGKATVVGYTQNDIENWSELMARSFAAVGADSSDIVQNGYGYGLFTGGLGAHYGAEKLGATVIPVSGGNTKRQLTIMQDFGSTVLTCTPSYALYLAEAMKEAGIDPRKDTKLKVGIFGAEPWTEEMRKDLEDKLGLLACDIYGLSEIMGPGVSIECEHQCGMHIFEDHFIAEIINPDTGEVLPRGETGELVITTITKEGIPVIRYRTRDITYLDYDKCECGRTHVRMKKVMGRTDDMLIIRGVNVFPSQVESVLMKFSEVEPHYLLVVDRINNLDTLEVWVEMSDKLFSDEVKDLEILKTSIENDLDAFLQVKARVKLVEPKSIERSMGKAKRVDDRRKIKNQY